MPPTQQRSSGIYNRALKKKGAGGSLIEIIRSFNRTDIFRKKYRDLG